MHFVSILSLDMPLSPCYPSHTPQNSPINQPTTSNFFIKVNASESYSNTDLVHTTNTLPLSFILIVASSILSAATPPYLAHHQHNKCFPCATLPSIVIISTHFSSVFPLTYFLHTLDSSYLSPNIGFIGLNTFYGITWHNLCNNMVYSFSTTLHSTGKPHLYILPSFLSVTIIFFGQFHLQIFSFHYLLLICKSPLKFFLCLSLLKLSRQFTTTPMCSHSVLLCMLKFMANNYK